MSQSNEVSTENSDTNSIAHAIVGGDEDKHGCKASAGYTWSELRQECIRVFESADIKLSQVDTTSGSTSILGIVFDKEKSKAEIFMPGTDNLILAKSANQTWSNSIYELKESKGYTFKENGKLIFESK
jgi:hypothetical protein